MSNVLLSSKKEYLGSNLFLLLYDSEKPAYPSLYHISVVKLVKFYHEQTWFNALRVHW